MKFCKTCKKRFNVWKLTCTECGEGLKLVKDLERAIEAEKVAHVSTAEDEAMVLLKAAAEAFQQLANQSYATMVYSWWPPTRRAARESHQTLRIFLDRYEKLIAKADGTLGHGTPDHVNDSQSSDNESR